MLTRCCIFLITGYGSALNIDGEVEMDAIIMEGKELKTGMCSMTSGHPKFVFIIFLPALYYCDDYMNIWGGSNIRW